MTSLPQNVDDYLLDGCGRCPLGGTPQCKVLTWTEELRTLRTIVLACGLTEEIKWGAPCYTVKGNTILMIAALKNYSVLSFFKGVLLKDEAGILEKPGENTQSSRVIKFTTVGKIHQLEFTIKAYIFEAIEAENAGLTVDFKQKEALVYPEELKSIFEKKPDLEAAFEALTRGRKRSYILHFSQAKQSKTVINRIEKCIPKIFKGKGFNEY